MENPVFQSLTFIEAKIQEKLTVEAIADSVYISKYHYQRLFHDIVGKSVMEYVAKRKMTLAGQSLLESGATILDIALRYGYASHEGFSRAFKACMGVTPSEYRKYGLAPVPQIMSKERTNMMYSKPTDEILRELNGFIAKAGEAAEAARKCELHWYKTFWNGIAAQTDEFAGTLKEVLHRVTALAGHPDEITRRFSVIKAVEDIAFLSHVMALHVGLTIARGKPEDRQVMQPICEKYRGLAELSSIKAQKIWQFLLELSGLIFTDMRKTAAEKLQAAVQAGQTAAERVAGYDYIKTELNHQVRSLSETPVSEMSVSMLEQCLFRLKIISFAAKTDVLRGGGADMAMVEGITSFIGSVEEAIEFIRTLPSQDDFSEPASDKFLEDAAYRGNVLLFYTRGEYEKLGESPTAFDEKIYTFIVYAQNATGTAEYQAVYDALDTVCTAMTEEAERLKERGEPIRYLTGEFKNLADAILTRIR